MATSAPTLPTLNPLGHSPRMARDPLKLFTDVVHECGDIAYLRFGPVKAWCLSSPEYVERVLVTAASKYRKETRGYRKLRLTMGEGLVTSEGDFWLKQRRIAQPAFARKALEGFAQTMAACGEQALDRLEGPAARGEIVDMAQEMNRLTLQIAGLTLCNLDLTGEAQKIGLALDQVLKRFLFLFTAPVPWPEYMPLPQNITFWRAVKTLQATVEQIITDRRRAGVERPDLLGMLMAARDEETGEGMSDRQLRDEALTMLAAGHETTANALAWTLSLLADHPEITAAAEAEVDAVLGGRAPT